MIVDTGPPFPKECKLSHDSSLEPILRGVEPAVRLVSERHLRKVLHFLIDWGRPLPTNPRLPFWVSRADLAVAEVLPPHVIAGTEPLLLLITDPNDRLIEQEPHADQLRTYWEALFQAAVMREIDQRRETGSLTQTGCRERLGRFGAAAREIRYVLESEHLVPADADDAAVYRAFAATYLAVSTFEHHRLEELFPSLPHGPDVGRVLAEDLGTDVASLLAGTRPPGASEPHREAAPEERWTTADTPGVPSHHPGQTAGLLLHAQEAEGVGNNVRAAVLYTQLAGVVSSDAQQEAVGRARAAIGRVVDALGSLFDWEHHTRQEWRQSLEPLLIPAATGVWPRAARSLYELQKISADFSRDVFAVDLPEYLRTLGRRPIRRPLPHAKPVRILMGLKQARAQMLRAGLGLVAQLRLDRLFHHQIHILENEIRDRFTPILDDALNRAGLVPADTVGDIAGKKLVAELLDRVCDRGYLRIGDLRDAIARNRLKMADLAGPRELLTGDALLKADTNLAYALDGVYRKGEFYLRWIQRFSALTFGTHIGRLFTLFVALPFGGSFLTLMFLEEMRHISGKVAAYVSKPAAKPAPPPATTPTVPQTETRPADPAQPADVDVGEFEVDDDGEVVIQNPVKRIRAAVETVTPGAIEHHHSGLTALPTILGFGVFILLMIHAPPFRRSFVAFLGHLWWLIRGVFWDVPLGVWRSPQVRRLRQSRAVRFLFRHFWSPLLITALVLGIMLLVGVNPRFLLRWWWAIWAGLTVAYNTPWGWILQDRIAESVSDWWRVVRVNLLPGLLATIIDWFRSLASWVERQLYAVDEWFRYRGGDSSGSLATKAVLGLLWFPVAYLFRFAFNLLVEPQINPIKHFPVVTVSHKMMLPTVVSKDPAVELSMFGELIATHTGWGVAKANFWAFWIIAGIPGIFGFVAWELVANWQLYAANRGRRLRPVMLGSHGESMRGLLRPGFHSGTVPKLFRKLRHANATKVARWHHELDHAVEGVHRFIERELMPLLTGAPEWGGIHVHLGAVRLGCQRVEIELKAERLGHGPFVLAFENINGHIEASVEQSGWADKLTDPQRGVFLAALRGILDMGAVERIGGRDRAEDLPPAVGFADLARRVSWEEWVERWGAKPTETTASTHR